MQNFTSKMEVIIPIAIIITACLLAISLTYKVYKAQKWKSIVLDKGYPQKEAKRYFWMAFLRERDAKAMIMALPDKNWESGEYQQKKTYYDPTDDRGSTNPK